MWKKIKDFYKDPFGVKALVRKINRLEYKLNTKVKELDKYTTIDADIGYRGDCTIILTGVYRGRGYVHFYDIPHEEFRHYVDKFRDQKRHSLIRNIDTPQDFFGNFNL